MVLHNDIWGNTSVTVIEEIDSRFLIAEELNMLALYSRLNKEQSKTLGAKQNTAGSTGNVLRYSF